MKRKRCKEYSSDYCQKTPKSNLNYMNKMDKKTISSEILKENGYIEHKGKFSKPEERFFQKKVTDKIAEEHKISFAEISSVYQEHTDAGLY